MNGKPRHSVSCKFLVVLIAMMLPAGSFCCYGQKRGYRLSSAKESTARKKSYGNSEVANTRNESDTARSVLKNILITGYDKKPRSSKESMFVTNRTDKDITRLSLNIDYRTPSGMQLHRRTVSIPCRLPAGETRQVTIDSWDTQHSFYYYKSDRGKINASPYTVVITPVTLCYNLQ